MRLTKYVAIFAAIVLITDSGLQMIFAADDGSNGRRLAIVVGVNTYRPNQGLENLKQAVNDARELSRVLRDAGFKVIEMTHEAAKELGKEHLAPNADFIRDQIGGIVETPNLGRDDTILITLHGHGVQYDFVEVTKKDGKEITNITPKLFFCPADASLLDSNGEKIQRANDLKERNHLVVLDELYEQLGLCKSATKLLIVDACRNDPSSPLFRSADNEKLKSVTMPKLAPPPGGIAAFFSCKANQRAVDDPELMHGVFTHYLIQGLQGKADLPLDNKPADGIVTLSELTTYVANNTYGYVFDKYQGLRQSPDIKGEFDTNTPLVRLPKKQPLPTVIPSSATGIKSDLIADDPDYLRGFALYWGHGTKIDQPQAAELLLKAANRNHALAMGFVALLHHSGEQMLPDPDEAAKWANRVKPRIQAIADKGDPSAQVMMGWFSDFGIGNPRDLSVAVKWYRKAAEQGFAIAQNNLGAMYERGDGVTKDPVEAAKWYRKAADQNLAMAQNNLGFMYESGGGGPKDFAEAVKWYRKAAEQNLPKAQNNLGFMYESGEGVPKDFVEAVKWYRKAAEQNIPRAQFSLGVMYENGKGVPKNTDEAVKWYRKAADRNNAFGQANLASCYFHGNGVIKDRQEAVRWYRKALANPGITAPIKKEIEEFLDGIGESR